MELLTPDRTNAHAEDEAFEEPTEAETAAAIAATRGAFIDRDTATLERDDYSGAVERLHFDPQGDSFTLQRVVDVAPVLEWCKGRFNQGLADRHCEFRQIAALPPEVLELWPAMHYGPNHGLPHQWYLQKRFHHLVVAAAHDRDLSGFKTLAGSYMRRGG